MRRHGPIAKGGQVNRTIDVEGLVGKKFLRYRVEAVVSRRTAASFFARPIAGMTTGRSRLRFSAPISLRTRVPPGAF